MKILGVETSCDETGVAVYDTTKKLLCSHALFSQIKLHERYGGVVPEIASRSQLEKMSVVTQEALQGAGLQLADIDAVAVTSGPGLVGSLLVGMCFSKGIAWAGNKKLIGVNHHEGHLFSVFLGKNGEMKDDITFPFIALSASGGHTALYLVLDFGRYDLIAQTQDDAAGEAFDKIAKILGLGYPGGALIEQYARNIDFRDDCRYPRTKSTQEHIMFSFSGLKTAVLYDLVKKGAYNLATGPIVENISEDLRSQVSSSLLVSVGDIFSANLAHAFKKHPQATGCAFVGGVACNQYLRQRLLDVCNKREKKFWVAQPSFCTDNGAMIAFVGGYKAEQGFFSNIDLDVQRF